VRPRTRPGRAGARLAGVVAVVVVIGASASCSSGDSSSGGSTTTARPTTTAPAGPPAGATAEGLRSLGAGQCFELPKDDPEAQDRAVWVVDCAQPHTHEVFDVIPYAGPVLKGGAYAGTAAVQDWAEQACYERFEPFVGIPWTRSDLEIESWWPSEDSWGRTDRSVICTVFPQNGGRTTGSQRSAGR
jgi:hypothetical protein